MALQREQRSTNPILIGGAILLLIILLAAGGIWVWRAGTQPAAVDADPLAGARANALEAAQGLEVFTVEYPQAAEQDSELAGAEGALARANAAFEQAAPQLREIDAGAVEQVETDFATVKEMVDVRAPADDVVPVADRARKTLLTLANGGE